MKPARFESRSGFDCFCANRKHEILNNGLSTLRQDGSVRCGAHETLMQRPLNRLMETTAHMFPRDAYYSALEGSLTREALLAVADRHITE